MNLRETATILAALRHWQNTVPFNRRAEWPHFEDCNPLTNEQIDALCERINTDDTWYTDDGESHADT